MVIFKGLRTNKKQCEIIDYGICKQTNCRQYKFIYKFGARTASLEVLFKGEIKTNHTEEFAYQLKGQERENVKMVLQTNLPNVVRHRHIEETDPYVIADGNWQQLRSSYVYQKARS